MEIAPWLGQETECNKWLSAKLRLSLNNPPTYDIVRRKFATTTTQTEREREREKATKRERERDRKKERKKEGERASWMPNAMVTAGKRAPQVEFPSSVLPGPF